ncbi:DEAD/DEAH box helicase [Dongshaea marina]|uniref:DEAD/DEAH box helicase n=1 Tax=Dongshaea marina TaxID=2047966 RepID=UPI000D3EACCB|nr:DEAD/DEAH box helicase [Dongshaea marina]
MSDDFAGTTDFQQLGLPDFLLQSLQQLGYHTPSPIQAKSIPHLLEGRDILGQAQTGTGKTAAFSLPMLARLEMDSGSRLPQALILAPTRELAIQVAESIKTYARNMPGVEVAAIYGGQDYRTQLRALRQGVQIVVGTPGRIMDHLRRNTLDLSELKLLVLDEADEMLRMGFIEDVEWILQHVPEERQTALFSATMPPVIRRITNNYLRNPQEVTVKMKTGVADTIKQSYWLVRQSQKKEALLRIIELEPIDAAIIFVRTRSGTTEIAEALEAQGYNAAALNGDMQQQQREQTIDRLKRGKLDIVVATDVAARGLDVERITHVFNYDIPYDTEAYVHRIGRTGRAGREGKALLLVTPGEKRMLRNIERATRQSLNQEELPTVSAINEHRVERLKSRLSAVIEEQDLHFFHDLLSQYQKDNNLDPIQVAAAMAVLHFGKKPLLLDPNRDKLAPVHERRGERERGDRRDRRERGERGERGGERRPRREMGAVESGMKRYRVDVGRDHGVKPSNLVGAIANEGGIDSSFIGRINIFNDFSVIDLPEGMPSEVESTLRKTRVSGQPLNLAQFHGEMPEQKQHARRRPNHRGNDRRNTGGGHRDRSSGNRRPNRGERSENRSRD